MGCLITIVVLIEWKPVVIKKKKKWGWVGPQNVGDLSQWRLGGQARLFEANWWRLLFADSRPADDGRRRPLATVSFRLIATLTASNHACKTVVDLKVDLDLFFSVALYLPSRTSRIVTYIEERMSVNQSRVNNTGINKTSGTSTVSSPLLAASTAEEFTYARRGELDTRAVFIFRPA